MLGLDVSRSPVGHSLALHLLLLLEDLVGLHCQPLLHEELLPLELTLPCLLQPFPVCHEQLPALLGGDCESSAPGEKGLPLSRSWSGVMGGHRRLLNLQLQLRQRWSGCGYSSGHSQPVDTGTVIQLGPDSQTGAMQAESVRVSQPSQHWLDEVYEEEITAVGDPTSHLLVVHVGEVDAIDFHNLVPCLGKKKRVGVCACVRSLHSSAERSPGMPDIKVLVKQPNSNSFLGTDTVAISDRDLGGPRAHPDACPPRPLWSSWLSNITLLQISIFC